MSRQLRSIPPPATSAISLQWVVVIAAIAFLAGAATSWLIFDQQQPKTSPLQAQQPPSSPPLTEAISAAPVPPDLAPTSPGQAAVALGNWNYDRKLWQKAIESYQRAISLGMDNANVRTDLANALRFSGFPQQALAEYQIARREEPQHENSLCNLATLYAQVLNDPGNAVLAWQEYLRRFPDGDKAPVARQYIAATSQNLP